jgi:hypothetical protein
MKRSILLPILALGAISALACGGSGDYTPPPPREAGREGYSAHFDVECDGILGEFAADEAAANTKYKGMSLFVTGTVETEISGTKVALVAADGSCAANTFTGSAAKKAKEFTAGGTAEFLCSFDNYTAGSITFKDCSPYIPE